MKNPLSIFAFAVMLAGSAQAIGAELLTTDQLDNVTAGWYSGNPGAGAGGLGTPNNYYSAGQNGGSQPSGGEAYYYNERYRSWQKLSIETAPRG